MFARSTKPNRCRHCRERMPLDKARHVIHPECVDAWLEVRKAKQAAKEKKERAAKAKVERADFKKRKVANRSFSDLEEDCRKIVQHIARMRDRNDGCISCDKPASWGGQWHGSHYRSHGACTATQFHLWNINKACWICNKLYSGRINVYEPRLIAKIGQEKVDWIKAQNRVVKHDAIYREYLYRFKAVMGKRERRMEKKLEQIGATA